MARTVTLATLQTRTLQRAAMQYGSATNALQGSGTSGQPQGELVDAINEGLASLWTMLGDVDGQPYYLQSVTFNTIATQDTYTIGPGQYVNISDFWKANGFDVMWGENIVLTLRPFNWRDRNSYKFIPSWTYTYPLFYRMIGKQTGSANAALDSVKFIPLPAAFSVTMWYLPTPPVLVNTTDTFDGIMGFEEFVILDAAEKLLIRQEQFEHAQVLAGKKAEERDRILGSIMTRDAENPDRVVDVSRNAGMQGWGPGY